MKIEGLESKGLFVWMSKWNSTYIMLETTLNCNKEFDQIEYYNEWYFAYFENDEAKENSIGSPFESNWTQVAIFVKLLRIFYDLILKSNAL